MVAALKATAKKGQQQLIDLILKIIDGKAKAAPNKTLARLLRIQENRPVIYEVLDLLSRFGAVCLEHELVGDFLHALKELLKK